jgi:hypothetical protein
MVHSVTSSIEPAPVNMVLPVINTTMIKEHIVQETTSNTHILDIGGIQQVHLLNEASPPRLQNAKNLDCIFAYRLNGNGTLILLFPNRHPLGGRDEVLKLCVPVITNEAQTNFGDHLAIFGAHGKLSAHIHTCHEICYCFVEVNNCSIRCVCQHPLKHHRRLFLQVPCARTNTLHPESVPACIPS